MASACVRTPGRSGAPLNRLNSTTFRVCMGVHCQIRLITGDEAKDDRKEPPVTLYSHATLG